MGLFSNLLDNFKARDFHMNSRMKVASVQRLFKENFGLTLRIYKGKQFADPKMTISQLNKQTSDQINANEHDITIKASMKIGDFEKEIKKTFGLNVQVADEWNRNLQPDQYTLGQAARKEPLIDWLKERNYDSIEAFLEKHNCKTLKEYYDKH
tara:strand:- start:106 stop:564 length:459 start_codon:yes stop_codon:yes gene_type:complete